MTASLLRLGVHVSISGGMAKALARAQELGCSAMQIFSRNPRGWGTSPLPPQSTRAFREAAAESDIDPIVIHTPYLLNLASEDAALNRRSIAALAEDLERAQSLGARLVVTHLGSGKEGRRPSSRRQVVKALKKVMEQDAPVSLLLENSAGAGNTVGSSFEEIGEIIEGVAGDPRIGLCFDTCHGFAAGYDFRGEEEAGALLGELDRTIGLKRLKLLHLNDCSGPPGARLDRHQHIGKGQIGRKGFRSLLSQVPCQGIPMILETPKRGPEDDLRNLFRIRSIVQSLRKKTGMGDSPVLSG
jgi:deoxyribonuclease-4